MAWHGGLEGQGRRGAIGFVVATIGVMAMMSPGPVHGQSGVAPAPAPKAVAGPETNIIPSVSVSARYDSNVFFIPGSNLEDYVTTVSPQLRVVHKRQFLEATASGGVTAEAYVKNPGLNYVGVNGLIDLNLDGAVSELARGLGLKISDSFYYTPQAPAFAPSTGGGEVPSSFLRGIQAQRANSFTNSGRVAASYDLSPTLSLTAMYLDQRIRFGNAISSPTGEIVQRGFFNTNYQTVTSGFSLKVSPRDIATLSYQRQTATFDATGGSISGSPGGFTSQGPIAEWTSLVTPTLKASMTGGVTVFTATNNLQYVGSASLLWKGEDTELTLSYTRVIAPSFYVVATPLLSQVVAAGATHHVTESFSVSLYGNYAVNQSVPDSSLVKYESYSVTPSVAYTVNRVITATVSYTRSMFDQTFSSQASSFERNLVMLRVVAEWK